MVAAALFDDLHLPTRMLAARRSRPAALAGRWEFPGGKVQPGEDVLAALHREIREELGVAIEVGGEVPGPDHGTWQISQRYSLRLWTATVTAGEPQPLVEHDELRWLPIGAWSSVPWLDADVRIVDLLTVSHGQGPAAQP